MDGGVIIVAVAGIFNIPGRLAVGMFRNSRIAPAVTVVVLIPGYAPLIGFTVAIIIDAVVADFHNTRVDGGISVVTIDTVVHVTYRLDNGISGNRGIAVTVTVTVLVPVGTPLIRETVTIIIDAVTYLGCSGIDV